MSADNESLFVNMADKSRFEVTRENATLYTFVGHTAIGDLTIENANVNHVFLRTNDPDTLPAKGMYIFNEFDPDTYKDLTRHMSDHRFPMILNMLRVPECDLKVWFQRVDKISADFVAGIPDEVPEK